MTRDSLMLSDTLMVLLRQYIQLEEDHMILASRYVGVSRPASDEQMIRHIIVTKAQIQAAVFYELSLLWRFPDLTVIRHLDWHVILGQRLLAFVEAAFRSPEAYQSPRQVQSPITGLHDEKTLMSLLVEAYTRTLKKQMG